MGRRPYLTLDGRGSASARPCISSDQPCVADLDSRSLKLQLFRRLQSRIIDIAYEATIIPLGRQIADVCGEVFFICLDLEDHGVAPAGLCADCLSWRFEGNGAVDSPPDTTMDGIYKLGYHPRRGCSLLAQARVKRPAPRASS